MGTGHFTGPGDRVGCSRECTPTGLLLVVPPDVPLFATTTAVELLPRLRLPRVPPVCLTYEYLYIGWENNEDT